MNTFTGTNDLDLLFQQAEALLDNETDSIANMANLSALIYHSVSDLNWVGFYIYKDNELVLGPFQGLPACVRLQLDQGVCGTAATLRKTLVVADVHSFVGHIACDSASNSEVVIPIQIKGEVVGVLDVDSPLIDRFDEPLVIFFEKIVQLYIKASF
jgi:GAF domain-containing protein